MLIMLIGLIAVMLATVAAYGVARIAIYWTVLIAKLAWWIVRLPFRVARFTIIAAWHVGGDFARVLAWGMRRRAA